MFNIVNLTKGENEIFGVTFVELEFGATFNMLLFLIKHTVKTSNRLLHMINATIAGIAIITIAASLKIIVIAGKN